MFWQFFTAFPLFMLNSKSLLLLSAQSFFFIERRERFAIIALYKKNDREWFAHVALKKEQKMSDALEKPESEVPTLEISGIGTF